MAGANAMNSYKTRIYRAAFGVAAPVAELPSIGDGEWTRVAEVISINGVPMNSSVTRITHLESDSKAHEKIPGFMDGGQVTFRLNYYKANAGLVFVNLPDSAGASPSWDRLQWLVQFPDGGQWYCTAFIQGMPFEVPEDDRITLEVTLEISGYPSFNSA